MIKILSFIMLFFLVTSFIGFLPNLSIFYFVLLPFSFVYCLFHTSHIKINYCMFLLIVACVFSILVGQPLSLFRSWQRLFLFVLVCSVISPLFWGDSFYNMRKYLFFWLIKFCNIITLLSFLAYFVGINYMTGGYFGGITNHSMILAPIASISFISSLVASYRTLIIKKRYLYILLAIVSLLCVLLSASRSALIGALCSALLVIIFENRKSFRKLLLSLGLLICLTIISFPLWLPYATDLIKKQDANVEMGGTGFYSREKKWNAREYEFKKSPVFGVGFAAIDVNSGDYYNEQNGQIEPGTSWGGILSMVGIFGFFPILYMFIVNFYSLIKKSSSDYVALIIVALLLFYSIHLIAEGYIFGSGSFIFFTLWLTLGIATDNRKMLNKIK